MRNENGKARPLTEEEYLVRLKGVHGDEYSLAGRYVNMNVRTKFVKKDGTVVECTPGELLRKKFQ